MIKVNVLIRDKNWKKYIKKPEVYLKNKLKKLYKKNSFFKNKKLEFSLLLTGNEEIKILNKKFRKKNKITDVLSFPFHEKKILNNLLKKNNKTYLGDIIVNLKKIIKGNEKETSNLFDRLWVHGFLHLLGREHKLNKDFKKMNREEDKFYNSIN